jgi:molybdopterin-guanine dinucleotide biosynthesis protein A
MALASTRHDRSIVVACDLPYLNPRLLAWMAGMPFEGEALVPLVTPADDGGTARAVAVPQSLHAIYHRSCLPTVRRLLAHGERRVQAFLGEIGVQYIAEAELERIDPGLASFLNANTADDWRRLGENVGR